MKSLKLNGRMGVWLAALTLIACGGKINKVLTETDTTVAEEVIPLKDTLLNIEDQMPETAVRQPDAHFHYAVYINEEKPASGEGEMDAVKSVWLCNERSGTVIKVCETNPMAEALWSKMADEDANAVDVPFSQIAAADKAMIAPGDVNKVIVEGCPDGRNIWTYIIDPYIATAKQLPSSEGVVALDWEKKEITAASYGYDEGGRYSVKKVYSIDGKFLRVVGDKERE